MAGLSRFTSATWSQPLAGEHFKPGARKSRGAVHLIGSPIMEHDSPLEAYCVHVWIRGIHPMLWRRQDGESRKKLLKAVREFRGYIEANQNFIPNYGDRYRHGEKISTAFAESAVNQVVSKRMVKKQQMRWTESGAHNLLQVRTKVLNDQLWESFVRWYPGMQTEQETEIQNKAA